MHEFISWLTSTPPRYKINKKITAGEVSNRRRLKWETSEGTSGPGWNNWKPRIRCAENSRCSFFVSLSGAWKGCGLPCGACRCGWFECCGCCGPLRILVHPKDPSSGPSMAVWVEPSSSQGFVPEPNPLFLRVWILRADPFLGDRGATTSGCCGLSGCLPGAFPLVQPQTPPSPAGVRSANSAGMKRYRDFCAFRSYLDLQGVSWLEVP